MRQPARDSARLASVRGRQAGRQAASQHGSNSQDRERDRKREREKERKQRRRRVIWLVGVWREAGLGIIRWRPSAIGRPAAPFSFPLPTTATDNTSGVVLWEAFRQQLRSLGRSRRPFVKAKSATTLRKEPPLPAPTDWTVQAPCCGKVRSRGVTARIGCPYRVPIERTRVTTLSTDRQQFQLSKIRHFLS